MTVRLDAALKSSFDALCSEFGMSANAAMTVFAQAVVRERRIPFDIKADPSENYVRERALSAFLRMRESAKQAGLQDMSLEEVNALIGEVRNGKE